MLDGASDLSSAADLMLLLPTAALRRAAPASSNLRYRHEYDNCHSANWVTYEVYRIAIELHPVGPKLFVSGGKNRRWVTE